MHLISDEVFESQLHSTHWVFSKEFQGLGDSFMFIKLTEEILLKSMLSYI